MSAATALPLSVLDVPLAHRAQWRRLLRPLIGRGVMHAPCSQRGPALVIFRSPDGARSLPLLRLADPSCDALRGPRPSLSFRLAALQLAHHLPAQPASPLPLEPPTWIQHTYEEIPDHLRLRIPLSVIGPLREITTSPLLFPVLSALRASHPTLPDLFSCTTLPAALLRALFSLMLQVGLLAEGPRPGAPATQPFDLLGLHWSAYDAQIRRRLMTLSRISLSPTEDRRVQAAFEALYDPQRRAALRTHILSPPLIAEALCHYRAEIQRLLGPPGSPLVIDRCRRILELCPSDRDIRRLLHRHLHDLTPSQPRRSAPRPGRSGA